MEEEIRKVIRIWKIVQDEAPNIKSRTSSAMDDALLELEGLLERVNNKGYDRIYKIMDDIRDITYELSQLTKKSNSTWKDIGIVAMMRAEESKDDST